MRSEAERGDQDCLEQRSLRSWRQKELLWGLISAASFAGSDVFRARSPRSASLRVGLVVCPTASQPRLGLTSRVDDSALN
jgi:hypothetical protein